MMPTPEKVAAYLGRGDDPATVSLAGEHLPIVAAFVEAYTRGNGFTDGQPDGPLGAVITAAAGRLVPNPEQVTTYTAGDYSERPAVLDGFTLPELAILHRYRRRTA